MDVKWNTEKPTQKGFYWFKGKFKNPFGGWDSTKPMIAQIDNRKNGIVRILLRTGIIDNVLLVDMNGQWIGPLEIPVE